MSAHHQEKFCYKANNMAEKGERKKTQQDPETSEIRANSSRITGASGAGYKFPVSPPEAATSIAMPGTPKAMRIRGTIPKTGLRKKAVFAPAPATP